MFSYSPRPRCLSTASDLCNNNGVPLDDEWADIVSSGSVVLHVGGIAVWELHVAIGRKKYVSVHHKSMETEEQEVRHIGT